MGKLRARVPSLTRKSVRSWIVSCGNFLSAVEFHPEASIELVEATSYYVTNASLEVA